MSWLDKMKSMRHGREEFANNNWDEIIEVIEAALVRNSLWEDQFDKMFDAHLRLYYALTALAKKVDEA